MIPGIDLIQIVQFLGYPGLFIVIFLESGVFFGFFLPGASLLFVAGMLASLGIFNIWIIVPLLLVAAILGDTVGYWFGSYVGKTIYNRQNTRFFRQEHVELAHDFFRKWGKAAVLLARFVPIVRTFTPILAGVGKMEYRIFLFYNVLGAIVWACGVTLVGYFIGRQIPDAEHYLTPILAGIIIVTTIPLFLAWWKHWKKEQSTETSARIRAVVFDLDNTLSRAIEPLSPHVAAKLAELLSHTPVAIMSGASFERMQRDVLPTLPAGTNLENLFLFPDTGARCYRYKKKKWKETYKKIFAPGESEHVAKILEEGLLATGITERAPQYGERILKRDAQVTLAGIGLDAPAALKAAWDPDRSKRAKLKQYLDQRLKGFDIRISSRTAIDITKTGIDKAFGVRWLASNLRVSTKHMLFVGDDLGAEGNDALVIPTGIQTRETSGPEETARIIEELLANATISE
jgi:membrane-associated protein